MCTLKTMSKLLLPIKINLIKCLVRSCPAPLIPALERQKQVDLDEIKINLVYRLSSRPARTI